MPWAAARRSGGTAKAGPQAAFAEVYATKAWGDDGGDFFSGPGTVEAAVTAPYLDFLRSEFAAMARFGRANLRALVVVYPKRAEKTGG